jgi:hypothetical protein
MGIYANNVTCMSIYDVDNPLSSSRSDILVVPANLNYIRQARNLECLLCIFG